MKIIITEKEMAESFVNEFQLGMFINTLTVINRFSNNIEIEYVFVSSNGKERKIRIEELNKNEL